MIFLEVIFFFDITWIYTPNPGRLWRQMKVFYLTFPNLQNRFMSSCYDWHPGLLNPNPKYK